MLRGADSSVEILKQPLHTTIAVDTLEFGEFVVEEKLHIIISVKDFKAMVAHAGISNVVVKAMYSHPSSPMQISYSDEGIMSELIFMTIGESRGGSATPAPDGSRTGSKRQSRQPLQATSSPKTTAAPMLPPPMSGASGLNREITRSKVPRPSPPPPQPSIQSQGLFVGGDEDRRWDPATFDEEEEMLLWDTGGEKVREKDH